MHPKIRELKNVLIVSCQAAYGEPLCSPEHILALALSAINGGAKALRLEGIENIAYVRKHTDLPIVGLTKSPNIKGDDLLDHVYITATFAEADAIAKAGADIVAIDATARTRPHGKTAKELIQEIHDKLQVPVWADIATFEEGIDAASAQTDIMSTTMSGYTRETRLPHEAPPDFELLKLLTKETTIPVVLEGRVWHPEEVSQAFKYGAYAVVVGSAITRPQLITKRFVDALPAGINQRNAHQDL